MDETSAMRFVAERSLATLVRPNIGDVMADALLFYAHEALPSRLGYIQAC